MVLTCGLLMPASMAALTFGSLAFWMRATFWLVATEGLKNFSQLALTLAWISALLSPPLPHAAASRARPSTTRTSARSVRICQSPWTTVRTPPIVLAGPRYEGLSQADQPGHAGAMVGGRPEQGVAGLGPLHVEVHVVLPRVADAAHHL